ncbi:ribosomal L1 domain-containing protein 1 [Pogona vitticeps]
MEAADGALPLDPEQIKKATLALLAYFKNKKKTAEKLLLNEDQNFFLMITVWKIPSEERVIKIPLPHGILPITSEVCLFTKDEPGLTAEQTENLYKKLLTQHGITNIAEVISYKTLKTEYKPFEAKRRLLGRFALFLSDDRIRRLLPSHIGKHFYKSKKAPLSVNLKAKDLAKEINKHIQGTILPVTNKGCCYTIRIAHTGMEAWQISENILAAAKVVAAKAPKIWKSVKILHLKTGKSVALPIFNWSHPRSNAVEEQTGTEAEQEVKEQEKKEKKVIERKTTPKARKKGTVAAPTVDELEEEDEEIPQLVPIEREGEKRRKVTEPSASGKNIETVPKESTTFKKKTVPSLVTPETPLDIPEDESSLHIPKLLKKDKKSKEVLEKAETKTPKKRAANSSVTTKMGKGVIKSARKAPKTPKRELKKLKVPQSA